MIPLEQESSDMTPRNFAVIKRQLWIDNASTNHSVRFCKIVLIVAVCAAECDYGRNSIATATSSPCTLLIVRTPRRHIAQGHAGQCTNINTYFHRCSARKNVNSSCAV